MHKVLMVYVKLKEALTGSIPKGKVFDSTDITVAIRHIHRTE